MISSTCIIKTRSGLHLRPAGALCNLAIQYKCSITLVHGTNRANAKSVLSVLGACVKMGDQVEFICDGEDEAEALAAILQAIDARLGEEKD